MTNTAIPLDLPRQTRPEDTRVSYEALCVARTNIPLPSREKGEVVILKQSQ